MMLHTKYQGSRPWGFRQDFFTFPSISLCKTLDLRGGAIFWPQGYYLNKLGRGPLGLFFMLWCLLMTFFKINSFQKILSGTLSLCQTAWFQIRTDILSPLFCVQTVCKGCQQSTYTLLAKYTVRHKCISCMSVDPLYKVSFS